jgi:O-antigen/teichoic acid export membrane protein
MLRTIKSSVVDTIIYGIGNIAIKIVGLLLIPVFTNQRYLTINDFGIMGILDVSSIIFISFLASALPQSFTRWFWDKDFRDNQKGIFFMVLSLQTIVSAIFCIVLIPISTTVSNILFSKPDYSRVITYVIIASGFQALNNILFTMMRLQSKSILYSLTNIFKLAVFLGFTLYYVLLRGKGLEGIYLAQIISNASIILFLFGYIIKNSKIYFDIHTILSMSSYGFPLLLANFSAALLTVIDRYSLNSLAVLKSVALYNLAIKITSTLKLIMDSIRLAIGPTMIKKIDSPSNKRFYAKVLLYSSYVIMFIIIGISIFAFEIIRVLATSKEYWGAVIVIPILSLSYFFTNMKDVAVYGLHIVKKTKIIGIIVTFSLLFSLSLNLLLIPRWDILGSAIATLLSQAFYWYVCFYYSQKYYFIPYEMKKLGMIFLMGIVLSFSSLLLNGISLLPRIILKILCLTSFPFILYLFNFYEQVELKAINGFIRKWLKFKNIRNNLVSLTQIADNE